MKLFIDKLLSGHLNVIDLAESTATIEFVTNVATILNKIVLFDVLYENFSFSLKFDSGVILLERCGKLITQKIGTSNPNELIKIRIVYEPNKMGLLVGDSELFRKLATLKDDEKAAFLLSHYSVAECQSVLPKSMLAWLSKQSLLPITKLPVPIRKKDVMSKLDYANHRHQELMEELFESKRAGRDPAFLIHTAADIVATTRECFDYLGQDIIECYIVPNTQNPRIVQDHAAGKLKAYFPYYESQILRPDSVFNELSTIQPVLFTDLISFAKAIASGASIPNTLLTYIMLLEVKDMVNEKKHDKLIGIIPEGGQEFLIENENMKVIIPIKDQSGWSSFSVEPGTKVSKVSEYRFEHNDQEVGKFCLFSTGATRFVISDFYTKHFA